jgi:hypothetical protein
MVAIWVLRRFTGLKNRQFPAINAAGGGKVTLGGLLIADCRFVNCRLQIADGRLQIENRGSVIFKQTDP